MGPDIFLNSEFYTDKNKVNFKKAIIFAKEVLLSKKRLSGDTFFDHNIRVANILAENRSSPETIIAGLIHATIKYVPEEKVETSFGKEILYLVKGVEDINIIKQKNENLTAEALRRVLLATIRDVRIIIIKLVDKLDNQNDVTVLEKKEYLRISQEILDIYAPLAYRLGLEKIRTKLEDLAFKVLKPKKYEDIQNFLESTKEDREQLISKIIDKIKVGCDINLIKIKGRSKHVYSIFKKVVIRGVNLDEQYDHLGIRIIVKDEKDCYSLLGFLHEKFDPIQGRLKDYIANPKPNGYRSIHTAVFLESRKRLELQIRTEEMDEFAEEGLAAHWRYKGLKSDHSFEKRMAWLRGVLDMQKNTTAKEFLENVKVDIFTDEIYCYTPKGDVRYFPKGSTILDFAYTVHEEVGNHTIGGRIDGKFVPIKTELIEGAVIEILTSKKQLPRRNWIKFVVSSRAKQKIRKGVKKYQNLPAFHYRKFKPIIRDEHDSLVESLDFLNAVCVLTKCCYPVPDMDIVGIITKRRLISVHVPECRQAKKDQDRWVNVQWKETFNKKIKIFVDADDRSGLLADLLHTIASAKFEVSEAKAKFIGVGSSQCSFVIVPKKIEEIAKLVQRVKKVNGVKRIYFE